MKRFKKLLACMLSVLMLTTAFPITALANEISTNASGQYGDFIWEYTASTDTLYINSTNATSIEANEDDYLPTYYTDENGEEYFWNEDFSRLIIGNNIKSLDYVELGYNECVGYYSYPELESVTFEKDSKFETVFERQFQKSQITGIDLPASVKHIGQYAFAKSNLKSIRLDENILDIGKYAFWACKDLESVYINSTLHTLKTGDGIMPDYCFAECSNLKNVEFGNKIISIGNACFQNCSSLKALDLNNVKRVGTSAFKGAGLVNVELQGASTIMDMAFQKCKIESITFDTSKNTASKIDIGRNAFADNNIKSLTVPSDVEVKINDYAFYNSHIKEVNYDEGGELGIVELHTGAFANNDFVNLKLPFYETDYFAVGSDIFEGCKNMQTADISNYPADTFVSTGMFKNCNNLGEVTLPDHCGKIEASAFENCYALSKLYNTSLVRDVEENAFKNCTALGSFKSNNLRTIGSHAFENSGIGNIVLSNTTPNYSPLKASFVGDNAFAGCKSLTNITLPNDLTEIKENTFYMCINLKKGFSIPNSVKTIGANAFGKTSITSIYIPQTVTSIDDTILNIDEKINSENLIVSGYTGSEAYNYAKRNNITFNSMGVVDGYVEETPAPTPDGPTEEEIFEANTKAGTWTNGTWELKIQSSNTYTLYIYGEGEMVNNIAIDNNGRETTFAELAKDFTIDRVYVKNGVTSIADGFMKDNKNLFKLVTPSKGLTKIGDYAFYGCTKLERFCTPFVESVQGSNAPINYIPSEVSYVGKYAFAYCGSLYQYMVFPENATAVEEGTFYQTSIAELYLPKSLERIEKKALAGCDKLVMLSLPNTVNYIYEDRNDISNNAFGTLSDGTINTNLVISCGNNDTVTSYCIRNEISYSINNIASASAYGTITAGTNFIIAKQYTLYWYYFDDTDTILITPTGENNTSTKIYDRISRNSAATVKQSKDIVYELLERGNFSSTYITLKTGDLHCKNLIVDEGVVAIDSPSLFGFFDPEHIELPSTLTSLNYSPFKGCSRLIDVAIPDAVTSFTSDDFAGCSQLTAINLGAGITAIPDGAFEGCSKLQAIAMPSVKSIGDRAFYKCVSLHQINLPDSVISIGEKAYYSCASVQSLRLGKNVSYIGDSAFDNLVCCNQLDINCSIPDGSNAFNNIGSSTLGCDLSLGSNVKNADFSAFNKSKIINLSIGENVDNITGTQYLPYVKSVSLNSNNNNYYFYNNAIYNKDDVLTYVPAYTDNVSIKAGTKAIGEYALYGTNVTDVTVPAGVIAIGAHAFQNAKHLKHINIEKGVTVLGDSAFEGCTALKVFYAPSTLSIIGSAAFKDCSKLASVVLLNKTSQIKDEAFMGCSSLACVVLNEDLDSVGDKAFMDCINLEEIYAWYNTEFGENVFDNDDKLTIHTMVGSDAYRYAREFGVKYLAYTDDDLFYDVCGEKFDIYAGYLGYCTDGHGDIEYLTVYSADCENDGYIIGVCEYCSEILEEQHIDSTGHNYKLKTQIPATATTRGVKVYTCLSCAQEYCTYIEPTGEDEEIETHTVSATVSYSANKTATKVVAPLKNVDVVLDNQVLTTTDENGAFTLELETGSYELELRYAYGFTRTIYVVIEDEDISYTEPIALIACDFNKDGTIDNGDLELFQIVISAKKDDPSYLDFVDINNDGYINAKDRLYISACKGLTTTTVDYPEIVIRK